MEKVADYLSAQGVSLDSLHAGVVITGGSVKLAGMREFLERYFDLPVRIGYPIGVIGLKEKVQDPAYATAVGLIKLAHKELTLEKKVLSQKTTEKNAESSFGFSSIIDKFKAFFKDIM